MSRSPIYVDVSNATSRWLSAFIALFSLSCGDQLIGSTEELSVLATLKVEVLPPFDEVRPEGPMRLGVLWLALSSTDAWCALNAGLALGLPPLVGLSSEGDAERSELSAELKALTQDVCRDPLGVAPGLAGESVPLSTAQLMEGGVLEVPFTRLPSAEVLFGSPDARLGYATVVLFEDLDGDGALTLAEAKGGRRRGRRGGAEQEEVPPDRVWGASFQSVITPHQRLAYHEGAEVVSPFFYPVFGCDPLPRGFGILESALELIDLVALLTPLLPSEGAPLASEPPTQARDGLCEVSSLDRPIQLQVVSPSARLQELVCRPLGDEGEEPPERAPEELELTCVSSEEVLAIDRNAECKGVSYWRLVGCPLGQPSCDEPRWDMRTNVPEWWPCSVERP